MSSKHCAHSEILSVILWTYFIRSDFRVGKALVINLSQRDKSRQSESRYKYKTLRFSSTLAVPETTGDVNVMNYSDGLVGFLGKRKHCRKSKVTLLSFTRILSIELGNKAFMSYITKRIT